MCGSAPKQEKSQAEVEQMKRAQARLQEWETDGYKQLELDQIAQGNVDMTSAIAGTSNADLEQSASALSQSGADSVGLGNAINAINSAKTKTRVDAADASQGLQTQNKMNAVKVGQDVAATVDFGLASAAQRGSLKARTDLQNKLLLSQAKGQMIGSIAQGAAAGYMRNGAKTGVDGQPLEPESVSLTNNSQFSRDAQMTDLRNPYGGSIA